MISSLGFDVGRKRFWSHGLAEGSDESHEVLQIVASTDSRQADRHDGFDKLFWHLRDFPSRCRMSSFLATYGTWNSCVSRA